MAQNELQVLENGSLDIASLNKNINNAYVECAIICKKIKASKEFTSVKVVMPLDVYDVDGEYKGHFNTKVDMHFQRKAFKRDGLEVSSTDDLTTGTLYVLASKIQAPRDEYRPQYRKNEDGTLVLDEEGNPIIDYPVVWVKDFGVVGFIPYVASQEAFTPERKKHTDATDANFEEEAKDLTTE